MLLLLLLLALALQVWCAGAGASTTAGDNGWLKEIEECSAKVVGADSI